jgi:plastocyanin
MTGEKTRRTRRRVLAGAGSLFVAGLAGCSSTDSGSSGNGDGNGNSDANGGDENGDAEGGRTEDAAEIFVESNNFNEQVVEIEPGGVVRWEHVGGTHTVTFYHEENDRQNRVPEGAEAVDMDMTNATDFFEHTLEIPGVYDYYCRPHEDSHQMIGTIVVGGNDDPDQPGLQEPSEDVAPFTAQEIEDLNAEARELLGI